jgi:acyl-CoA thioester hydrolase
MHDDTTPPAPLELHRDVVQSAWVDDNGHMNVAYYVLVFDRATDAVLDHLDLGAAYRTRCRCSYFVVEAHVTYENEVCNGEALVVASRILDADAKRIVLFHEMRRADDPAPVATNEVLCLHVDLRSRRSTVPDWAATEHVRRLLAEHRRLPQPVQAGRAIRLTAGRPAVKSNLK